MIAPEWLAAGVPHADGLPYLRCEIGGVEYALPIQAVRSVEALPPLTKIPFAPPWLVGLASVNGQALAAIDLGTLLGGPPLEQPRYLLVLAHDGLQVSLPVGAVHTVERIEVSALAAGSQGRSGRNDAIDAIWCPGDAAVTAISISGLFQLLDEKEESQE